MGAGFVFAGPTIRRTTAAAVVLVVALMLTGTARGSGVLRAEPASSGALTSAMAGAALIAHVDAAMPGAVFPRAEAPLCPAEWITATAAQCAAEYHLGATWGFVFTSVSMRSGTFHFAYYAHATWHRRWISCQFPRSWRGRGSLESNNDCGHGQYGSDVYFISQDFILNSHGALTWDFSPEVGWMFTDSAGYKIGGYHGTKDGEVYTYTNAVGNSFRYTR